jgi:hypothetical protein
MFDFPVSCISPPFDLLVIIAYPYLDTLISNLSLQIYPLLVDLSFLVKSFLPQALLLWISSLDFWIWIMFSVLKMLDDPYHLTLKRPQVIRRMKLPVHLLKSTPQCLEKQACAKEVEVWHLNQD